jgi:hypothetical protein
LICAGCVIYGSVAKAGAREQPITRHLPEILEAYLAAAEGDQQWLFPAAVHSPDTP